MAKKQKSLKPQRRFGIGEWYGKSFVNLQPEERRHYAEVQTLEDPPAQRCPFLSKGGKEQMCTKIGGVCSLRLYRKTPEPLEITIDPDAGTLRATCPYRFEQDDLIYQWIGEVVLNRPDAIPIGQVSFLERLPLEGASALEQRRGREDVGRFDNILLVPGSDPLRWCPVEIQAVYFSGKKMSIEFQAILEYKDDTLPFPQLGRRPDYRSSGPKRLMPQLQIKVPTLRRWGKKIAVVVDEDFFRNLGTMQPVDDLSNCDVAWFVVRFDESHGEPKLTRGFVHYTTLEASVEGLIAGRPVGRTEFEKRIQKRLMSFRSAPPEVSSD
jgi:hypothetical protein